MSTIALPDLRGPATLKPPNSGGTSPERRERKGDEVTGMGVLGSMKRATKVYSAMPLSMRTRRRERKRASRHLLEIVPGLSNEKWNERATNVRLVVCHVGEGNVRAINVGIRKPHRVDLLLLSLLGATKQF